MTHYSAVITTGIYCRPGCPARPNPANVRHFEQPAAAEAAGFRACLRCRPYRTAPPVAWEGSELVCRAVQLVLDGALDDGTEADLGARLGVSARHLRRLFNTHLGVTPDQLARSRRAHFARRLLDDTDLTVTEVAFAAGFGSLRQFNRACADLFHAAPTELRARRRSTDRLVADGGLRVRLAFRGGLDWDAMLAWFAARAIPGIEDVDPATRTYRRTVEIDGDAGVLELQPGGDDHLVLRAHLPHWEGLIHVVQRARRIANLDADLERAAAHLHADAVIGPLLADRPALRAPGTWDPFETGVRAIIGQQVSVAGATTITGRVAHRHGRPVPGLRALGLTHVFPGPAALARADLAGLGLTNARIDAVRAFAAAVAHDDLRLDRSAPLKQFIASVTAVPGLGPWTAHYLALRMGEPDAFPASDLGLRRSPAVAGPGGQRPSTNALEQLASRWQPWRAHAAMHLWAAEAGGPTHRPPSPGRLRGSPEPQPVRRPHSSATSLIRPPTTAGSPSVSYVADSRRVPAATPVC